MVILARSPVAYIWFLKSLPSRFDFLDMNLRDIERFYYEAYVIVDQGLTSLEFGTTISEESYQKN